jgi:hypothetical protein
MDKSTLITDLFAVVEKAEKSARKPRSRNQESSTQEGQRSSVDHRKPVSETE